MAAVRKVNKEYGLEIGIYEIDFLSFHGEIYSSHDYNMQAIQNGSPLSEWIEYIVFQERKILWLDIKENYWFEFNCGFEKFDVPCLFSRLSEIRSDYLSKYKFDIIEYIWIGCQERDLHRKIYLENKASSHVNQRWEIIMDMPTVATYALQRIVPHCMDDILYERIREEYVEYVSQRKYNIMTLDKLFFHSLEQMKFFIQSLKLPLDSIVILNSFDRSVQPIEIVGSHVIMQYDYSCIKG